MVKVILPCAGLGTRVGMRHDQSKELCEYNGKPLIQFALDICSKYGYVPHVITRKEKLDLIQFCQDRKITVQILDEPGREWADTVLKSQPYWADVNLFILPDTVWDNPEIVQELVNNIKLGNNAAFGILDVENQSKWSTINNYTVTEKPRVHGAGIAWGCFAFKKVYGFNLFFRLSQKDYPFKLKRCSFHSLKNFYDVTRKGTIGI